MLDWFWRSIRLNPYRNLALACNIIHRRPRYNPSADLYRIPIFNKAIRVTPRDPELYLGRGVAYFDDGDFEQSIQDFSEAIHIDSEIGPAFSGRALAWLCLDAPVNSRYDLSEASDLGYDFVSAFRRDYTTIAEFEQKYSITVPEDIRSMLAGE